MKHTLTTDKKSIHYHYDVSNDFYKLFLDKNLVYSCGYFRQTADDLDAAQENKLEHICRKLRLQPGETLLDIGCGWGGLIRYAVKHYQVRATGITLSDQQFIYAQEQIKKAGQEMTCQVKMQDYRELSEMESFDKIVSVGMIEHVGTNNLPVYFTKIFRLLKQDGLFLSHGITTATGKKGIPGASKFIDTYVFPDGELQDISYLQNVMEQSGFEILDVESLRTHYAKTLQLWTTRLQNNSKKALGLVDEKTYRIWLIYRAGCAAAFTIGTVGIYQVLLAKHSGNFSPIPLTRKDIYI
jgi:cyclopropane-fatty-acyl-phospholipid synthase